MKHWFWWIVLAVIVLLLVLVMRPAAGDQQAMQAYPVSIHQHSIIYSDGKRTILESAQKAQGRGIKAICMTDHYEQIVDFNQYCRDCQAATAVTGVLVIPGVEVEIGGDKDACFDYKTPAWVTRGGSNHTHILGLGIYQPLYAMERQIGILADRGKVANANKTVPLWQAQEMVIDAIRQAGGVPVLAHPYQRDPWPWRPGCYTCYPDHIKGIVGIEFFNDSDPEAVFQKVYLANINKAQLFVTAGCDSHGWIDPKDEERWQRLTYVFVPGPVHQLTTDEVLDALRQGRTYATCGDLRLGNDSAIPGYDQSQPDKPLKVVSPVQVTFNIHTVSTPQGKAKVAYFTDKFVTSPVFTEAAIRPETNVIRPEAPATQGTGKLYLLADDGRGTNGIWTVYPDGANLQLLMEIELWAKLDISSDGRYAFSLRDMGGGITVVDLLQKQVVADWEKYGLQFCQWLPGTHEILATRHSPSHALMGGTYDIVAVDPFTKAERLVWRRNDQGLTIVLTVAPNGQDLLFERLDQGRLVCLRIGGMQVALPEEITSYKCYRWSPDGQLIAAASSTGGGLFGSIKGTIFLVFFNTQGRKVAEAMFPPQKPYLITALTWSTDSQNLAVASSYSLDRPQSLVRIYSRQGMLVREILAGKFFSINGIAWVPEPRS